MRTVRKVDCLIQCNLTVLIGSGNLNTVNINLCGGSIKTNGIRCCLICLYSGRKESVRVRNRNRKIDFVGIDRCAVSKGCGIKHTVASINSRAELGSLLIIDDRGIVDSPVIDIKSKVTVVRLFFIALPCTVFYVEVKYRTSIVISFSISAVAVLRRTVLIQRTGILYCQTGIGSICREISPVIVPAIGRKMLNIHDQLHTSGTASPFVGRILFEAEHQTRVESANINIIGQIEPEAHAAGTGNVNIVRQITADLRTIGIRILGTVRLDFGSIVLNDQRQIIFIISGLRIIVVESERVITVMHLAGRRINGINIQGALTVIIIKITPLADILVLEVPNDLRAAANLKRNSSFYAGNAVCLDRNSRSRSGQGLTRCGKFTVFHRTKLGISKDERHGIGIVSDFKVKLSVCRDDIHIGGLSIRAGDSCHCERNLIWRNNVDLAGADLLAVVDHLDGVGTGYTAGGINAIDNFAELCRVCNIVRNLCGRTSRRNAGCGYCNRCIGHHIVIGNGNSRMVKYVGRCSQ
ncbi:MAG: hypothetical protein MJ192_02725 [Clostridia bacterium]|nr:hypothetical protein [Clostridia bacterium]